MDVLREQDVQRGTAELDAPEDGRGEGVRHRWKRSGADAGGGQLSSHERFDRCPGVAHVQGGDRFDHPPDGAGGADRDVGVAAGCRKGCDEFGVDIEEGDGPAGLAEQLAEEATPHAARAEDHGPSHIDLSRADPIVRCQHCSRCCGAARQPDPGGSGICPTLWPPPARPDHPPLPEAHWYQIETQSEHMLGFCASACSAIAAGPSLRNRGRIRSLARGGAREVGNDCTRGRGTSGATTVDPGHQQELRGDPRPARRDVRPRPGRGPCAGR